MKTMKMYCPPCRIALAADRRFCGRCGAPLQAATEVERELRQAFEEKPAERERMGTLLGFLKAIGDVPASGMAGIELRWCHAKVTAISAGTEPGDVQRVLATLPVASIASESIPVAIDCLDRAWPVAAPPAELVAALDRAIENTRATLSSSTVAQWGRACLRWRRALRQDDGARSRALLAMASIADPANPEVVEAVAAVRARWRRARMVATAVAAAVVVAGATAFLVHRYLHTSELLLTQPGAPESTYIAVSSARGVSAVLRPHSPGMLQATAPSGTYTIHVAKDGYAAWESTIVLAGRKRIAVTLPSLAPVGANALSDEIFAGFRRSPDPMLAYVNFVHDADHQAAFKPFVRAELSSARGRSVIRGFSNMDEASHADWASVWTLEAGGVAYEIGDYIGPASRGGQATYANVPAAYVESGDTHQGIGWSAKTWMYDDGRSYRFHTASYEFDNSTENTSTSHDTTSDGELKLKRIEGLSVSARASSAAIGAPITDPEVVAFVDGYLQTMNSGQVSSILVLYDDSVDYYRRRGVGRDYIYQDKSRFYARWPEVNYTMNGALTMSDEAGSGYRVVEVPLAFRVRDPGRHSGMAGTARTTLALVRRERIVIAREDQRVLNRTALTE